LITTIFIFFLLFQSNQEFEYVRTLSIADINHFIIPNQSFKFMESEINSILDEKFKSKKCQEIDIIGLNYHSPYASDICDFDVFTHYIEAKVKLGMKNKILKNEKIVTILNKTYNEYKLYYSNKDKFHPMDNKWNHIMNAMIALDLLDEEEKEFWITKYIYRKLNEDYSKFPQQWNRIWLFRSFGFYNIHNLSKKYNLSLSQVKENVCDYTPSLNSYKEENIFNEPEKMMYNKYQAIKNFCDISLTEKA